MSSNAMGRPLPASNNNIAALQAYITELTIYINDNNETYTKNLNTLKNFYEDEIDKLHTSINMKDEDLISQKNEINTLKDLLIERNSEIKELKGKNVQMKEVISEIEENLNNERRKNQQTYEHMDKLRQSMQATIDKQVSRCREVEEDQAQTMLVIKEKQNDIRMLKQQINALEQKVAQRYSLPEKMKDLQIQKSKDKTNIQNLQKKVEELAQNRDYLSTSLEKTKKQLQKMTIQANKSKGDLSYQIEVAVKKQKNILNEQIETLKIQNQRKVYEIKDLQLKLNEKVKLCKELESKMKDNLAKIDTLSKEVRDFKEDKELYLSQFRNLKIEYEIVINNLELAIPQYQKKNWHLEQENQDLNAQLNTLTELLRELKAMNDMEPVRGDYRKWAELSLAAEKKLPEQINPTVDKNDQFNIRENEIELNPDWDRLMADIEKIQI